jgi:hypothetical protein
MAAATEPIVVTMASGAVGVRSEERQETIRIVEYSRFPRAAPQQNLRIGFTRDLCAAGMCLGVDECEPVGSLLRLCVRDVDGRRANTFIGRVVWTREERDRRFWLGLELLTEALAWNPSIFPAGEDDGGIAISGSRVS